jgi:hypothetical protein
MRRPAVHFELKNSREKFSYYSHQENCGQTLGCNSKANDTLVWSHQRFMVSLPIRN